MSELGQWSAEDATPEERLLLEASRREQPDPAARARTLLALGIGAPPGGGPSSGPGGTGAAGATTRATLIKLLALAGGAVVLGAAIIGGISTGRDRVRLPQTAPTAEVSAREPSSLAPAVPSIAVRGTGETATVNDAPSLDPAPMVPPKPARGAQRRARAAREESSPALEPSLAEEVAVLDRARAGLSASETSAALRALDAYRARFVHGKLADEEVVLRVQVLLARGDRAGAAAVERTFSMTHPESPYVARLRALVRAEEKHEDKNPDKK